MYSLAPINMFSTFICVWQSGKTIPGFQLLVFKLNILQTDSFSGYEQNFKQWKHFEKAKPEILNLVL